MTMAMWRFLVVVAVLTAQANNARSCSGDAFECDNGRCIGDDHKCDGDDDCGDNSDEEGCDISVGILIAIIVGVFLLIVCIVITTVTGVICGRYHCANWCAGISPTQNWARHTPSAPLSATYVIPRGGRVVYSISGEHVSSTHPQSTTTLPVQEPHDYVPHTEPGQPYASISSPCAYPVADNRPNRLPELPPYSFKQTNFQDEPGESRTSYEEPPPAYTATGFPKLEQPIYPS